MELHFGRVLPEIGHGLKIVCLAVRSNPKNLSFAGSYREFLVGFEVIQRNLSQRRFADASCFSSATSSNVGGLVGHEVRV